MLYPNSDGQPEDSWLEEAWSPEARLAAAASRANRYKGTRFSTRNSGRSAFVDAAPQDSTQRYYNMFHRGYIRALRKANATSSSKLEKRSMKRAFDRSSMAGELLRKMRNG